MPVINESPQSVASLPGVNMHRMNRRVFLKRAGIGAGAVIVVAGVGAALRAVDQGVFATDEGSAYTAWREWDTQAGGGLLPLVRSVICYSPGETPALRPRSSR